MGLPPRRDCQLPGRLLEETSRWGSQPAFNRPASLCETHSPRSTWCFWEEVSGFRWSSPGQSAAFASEQSLTGWPQQRSASHSQVSLGWQGENSCYRQPQTTLTLTHALTYLLTQQTGTGIPRSIWALFYCTSQMCFFINWRQNPPSAKRIWLLLWWSGTKPVISLRHACMSRTLLSPPRLTVAPVAPVLWKPCDCVLNP